MKSKDGPRLPILSILLFEEGAWEEFMIFLHYSISQAVKGVEEKILEKIYKF